MYTIIVTAGFCNMYHDELIPHLFRAEFRKITAVLSKFFGIQHIEVAEDNASETFLAALESWTYKGIPPNPTAWLYSVAKNKAKNYISRHQLFREEVINHILPTTEIQENEIDLSERNITDSQLQMLFAICYPAISYEAQIGLALRILCGFGVEEISTALLSNKEAISKRLFRAREKLRIEKVMIEFPGKAEIDKRLETVLTTLYLLFNEGYYSETCDTVIREELCLEAMRLTNMLIENEHTNQPSVNALLSLMCFHSSRFGARKNENGELILYYDQDKTLWNFELISKAVYYLHQASTGNKIYKYHLEATIAYWHTVKEDSNEKWAAILHLYDQLLQLEYSPIAALNRIFALSKIYGKASAIAEAEKLNLATNHFYFTLLGELYKKVDNDKAKENFIKGLLLARSTSDKKLIQKKIDNLGAMPYS
ncbi:MAG: RNA polymerase sigma factor [Chitinophagaceae bacterium]